MYPAMLNIKNKKVTIIGGGKVAYRKAMTFLKFEAKVYVISPVFCEAFKELKACENICCTVGEYKETKLQGSFIVVAATNDKEINQEIGEYCNSNNILCNIIDDPKNSSFIVPAHIVRGDLVISVSTNGKSPILAKKIKSELEKQYDEHYKERLELLGKIREQLIKNEEKDCVKKQLEEVANLDLEKLREYVRKQFR